MATDIRVPEMGESVVEATVGKWLKHEGERVSRGDLVLELETEKVNLEIAAEQDGVLEKILHAEGDTVNVGDVLAVIGDASAPPHVPQGIEKVSQQTAAAEIVDRDPEAPQPAAPPQQPSGREPAVAPSARKLASESGVDVAQVQGSARGGTVTREDVAAAAARVPAATAQASVAPPAPAARRPEQGQREERQRMSRRRLTIARRLVEAQQTAAMLTTFNEIDMSAVMGLRKRIKESFEKRHGVGLGFMSFFTKASIGALKEFPAINAEIDGDEIVYKRYYNIGVAIGVEGGLVVPVLRDADQMSFADIERTIVDLSARARTNKLTLDELTGGTFTITNGGIFGSLMSTPILNTPEVGILGMHAIKERPVVVDGQIVIRPMMYVALSYDHRIVDGREAVQFLVRIKQFIEEPAQLLVEG